MRHEPQLGAPYRHVGNKDEVPIGSIDAALGGRMHDRARDTAINIWLIHPKMLYR